MNVSLNIKKLNTFLSNNKIPNNNHESFHTKVLKIFINIIKCLLDDWSNKTIRHFIILRKKRVIEKFQIKNFHLNAKFNYLK